MPSWTRAVRAALEAPHPVQVLRVLWCALVVYVERVAFLVATVSCRLPASASAQRVLIVSDPQVVGRDTYADSPAALFHVLRFFSDQYIRKAWRALRSVAAPRADLLVLLGDLSDRGRWYTAREPWYALQRRWERLFHGIAVVRNAWSPRSPRALPALVVPGNHDIGLPDAQTGQPTTANAAAAEWFREAFAPHVDATYTLANTTRASWNARIPIAVRGNEPTHELVLVDALNLVSMQPLLALPFDAGGAHLAAAKARAPDTAAMIDALGAELEQPGWHPMRILFSHVPLARGADERSCDVPWHSAQHGVRRESHRARVPGGAILQGGDLARTYQNLVQPDISAWVLDAVQPAAVFSGDDHDHCEVVHRARRQRAAHDGGVPGFAPDDVPELTVKSMSMLEGVRRPGYAWLTLDVQSDGMPSVAYTPCLLPDQVGLWLLAYVPFLVATLLYVAWWSTKHTYTVLPQHTDDVPMQPLGTPRPGPPPKRVPRRFLRSLGAIAAPPLVVWLALQH